MKKKTLIYLVLWWVTVSVVNAQEWTAPQLPGQDLKSLASTSTIYFYNVDADAFVLNGMDWNTNACATRLNAGDKSVSEAHRAWAYVNGTTVMVRLQSYGEKYISCLSGNAYDIWVDQAAAQSFTFAETTTGSHIYTLTNTTYAKPLDLAWKRGGHLTLTDGAGQTHWAFLSETAITNGAYARYKGQLHLYRLYEAIVASGKTNLYSEAIAKAKEVYDNSNATTAQLQTAAKELFTAAAVDIEGPLDVSFLFQNADMTGAGVNTHWISGAQTFSWGEFEKYHATLTLSQSQSVPAGVYDVCFRSLYREDGAGDAPVLTVSSDNTVTADVPMMTKLNFLVGNGNNNGWKSGEDWMRPDNMQSAAQAICHPDAQAVAKNVLVSGNKMTISLQMTSKEQWLNWQSCEIIYKGNGLASLRNDLSATIETAIALANEGGAGEAKLRSAIKDAETVLNNTSANFEELTAANEILKAAMETYRLESVSVEHPIDYNDRLVNRSFERSFTGWEQKEMQTQSNSAFALKTGSLYVEKWTGKGNSVGNASVLQTVSDLGLGVFIVKAVAHNIQEDYPKASQTGAWIVGNLQQTAVDKDDEYTLIFTNIEKDAIIGFKAVEASGNWLAVDQFELYWAGGDFSDYKAELGRYIELAESALSLKMEASIRTALNTAIANAKDELKKTTAEGYQAVSTPLRLLKEDAEVSASAFARLQAVIDEALVKYGDGSLNGASDFLDAIRQAQSVNDNLNSTQAQMQEEINNLQKAALKYMLDNPSGSKPKVTTDPRYLRGAVEAFGRMSVSGVNSNDILEQGFCYSTTNPEPTVLDERSTSYLEQNGRIYRMPMQPATIYYIRAYCMTKGYEVGYGDVIKMSTIPMGDVRWWYNYGGDEGNNNRVANALAEACDYWSRYTSIRGFTVSCTWSPGTPTADCGYGGGMRIGTNGGQRTGTCMHEMNHGIGGGTIPIWGGSNESPLRTSVNGDWAGERANAVLRFWENREDLVITAAYDAAHWGFRTTNGSYSQDNIWLNKYAFNGAHLEPYAWAGPQNWNDIQIVYIGNSLIQQGMCEDGLIPVNYWSGAFCLPAYVFPHEDDVKYYIKCEDENLGLLDSYLMEKADGTIVWTTIDTEDLSTHDEASWYVSFTPDNQYYQIRNASTGHYISYNNGRFKALNRTSITGNENFHLIRGRQDVSVGDMKVRGYWLIHPENNANPNTLTANKDGSTSAVSLNLYDSGSNQRWVFLDADDVDAFDQGSKKFYQADLKDLIAQIRKLKRVSHTEDVADADQTLEAALEEITAQSKVATGANDVKSLVADAREAAMIFLSSVTPTDIEKPFDLTFMIDNAAINDNSGWSDTPTFSYSCCEYFQRTFDFYQTLTNMPKGTYKLTAQAFQRPGSYVNAMNDYDNGRNNVSAQLYIGQKAGKIRHIGDGATETSLASGTVQAGSQSLYIPDNMASASAYFNKKRYYNEVLSTTTRQGTSFRIGLRGDISNSGYWTIFDDFHLLFYGSATIDQITAVDETLISPDQKKRIVHGVFDLQGRRIADSLEGLPQGIYIVDGRKVLVR